MRSQQGFTLIELSISLVIIALIAGGVLIGSNLIHAAELRSITEDINKYSAATVTFKDKYRYLPGDMPNATDLWGTNPGVSTPGVATYNGNGDNIIAEASFATAGLGEQWLFWQHLANAGMIEGIYTGVNFGSGITDKLGMNVPISRIPGSGYSISYQYRAPWDISLSINPTDIFHVFLFGGVTAASAPVCPVGLACDTLSVAKAGWVPTLTANDAWSIDKKIDDGKPATGKVQSNHSADFITPVCTTNSDPNTAQYSLNAEGNTCSLVFKTGF